MATAEDLAIKHQLHEDTIGEFSPLHHKSLPGRVGILQAVARTLQYLENTVFDAHVGNTLPHATGKQLDFYGWVAGTPRNGLDDYWYRHLIATAFQSKRCTGSVDELVELWRTATDGPLAVEFTRYKRNLIILTAWRTEWMPDGYAERVAAVVAQACPIGSVVLLESLLAYVGGSSRDYYPLPATAPQSATGAKVWHPVS